MRVAILVLTQFGAMCGGLLGIKWLSDAAKYKEVIEQVQQWGIAKDAVSQAKSLTTAAYLLVLGSLVAAGAGVANMIWKGKETIWGGALIGCALIPALFAAKSLVFTFFLVIAGGLAIKQGMAWKKSVRLAPAAV